SVGYDEEASHNAAGENGKDTGCNVSARTASTVAEYIVGLDVYKRHIIN
ncbi:hypothetical protein HGQ77_08515, partial [Staphylococcus aureus]|nr:hypothetical protein [Staphylococcus aureus]